LPAGDSAGNRVAGGSRGRGMVADLPGVAGGASRGSDPRDDPGARWRHRYRSAGRLQDAGSMRRYRFAAILLMLAVAQFGLRPWLGDERWAPDFLLIALLVYSIRST